MPLRVRRGGFVRLHLVPARGDRIEAWERLSVTSDHPEQSENPGSTFVHLLPGKRWSLTVRPPVGEPMLCTVAFEPGNHVLTIKAKGYEEILVPALVTAGEVTEVQVFMQRK